MGADPHGSACLGRHIAPPLPVPTASRGRCGRHNLQQWHISVGQAGHESSQGLGERAQTHNVMYAHTPTQAMSTGTQTAGPIFLTTTRGQRGAYQVRESSPHSHHHKHSHRKRRGEKGDDKGTPQTHEYRGRADQTHSHSFTKERTGQHGHTEAREKGGNRTNKQRTRRGEKGNTRDGEERVRGSGRTHRRRGG